MKREHLGTVLAILVLLICIVYPVLMAVLIGLYLGASVVIWTFGVIAGSRTWIETGSFGAFAALLLCGVVGIGSALSDEDHMPAGLIIAGGIAAAVWGLARLGRQVEDWRIGHESTGTR